MSHEPPHNPSRHSIGGYYGSWGIGLGGVEMGDQQRMQFRVKWKPEPHSETSVTTTWLRQDELEDAFLELGRAIAIAGYTEPRWWQYWRWSEHKPRPEIIRAYREYLLASLPCSDALPPSEERREPTTR